MKKNIQVTSYIKEGKKYKELDLLPRKERDEVRIKINQSFLQSIGYTSELFEKKESER